MTEQLLVLYPDQVSDVPIDVSLPSWARSLVDCVSQAASSGQTVTVTAEEKLLTPEQVAQRLGMHRSTISRKIKAGEINAVKVGKHNRIPYVEFLRFQESRWDRMLDMVAPDLEAELFGEA